MCVAPHTARGVTGVIVMAEKKRVAIIGSGNWLVCV